MSAYIDLIIEQGTTFNSTINITDEVADNVINISGYSISSQLRTSYYTANASETLVCTITDAANGEFTLSLAASNTANLAPGKYVFDIKTVDTNNRTSRLLEGKIIITPSVTG